MEPTHSSSMSSFFRCFQMFLEKWVPVYHQVHFLLVQLITPSDCGTWRTGHKRMFILKTSSAMWVWLQTHVQTMFNKRKCGRLCLCFTSLWWMISLFIIAFKDLLKIIYVGGNTAALQDPECVVNTNADKLGDGQAAESRTGIRTICVSPDGKHLASGDRNGMLR